MTLTQLKEEAKKELGQRFQLWDGYKFTNKTSMEDLEAFLLSQIEKAVREGIKSRDVEKREEWQSPLPGADRMLEMFKEGWNAAIEESKQKAEQFLK